MNGGIGNIELVCPCLLIKIRLQNGERIAGYDDIRVAGEIHNTLLAVRISDRDAASTWGDELRKCECDV